MRVTRLSVEVEEAEFERMSRIKAKDVEDEGMRVTRLSVEVEGAEFERMSRIKAKDGEDKGRG
jgi:RNA-binding protein YlmH